MSSPPVAQLMVVSCVPTATLMVSACEGPNRAIVVAMTAALILKELKSIIELSPEAGPVPAATRDGTIEGVSPGLKQLLASMLLPLAP